MNESLPPQKISKLNKIKGILAEIRLPRAVKIIYIIAAACLPLNIIFLLSESFSDFFNRYISSVVRGFFAYLTSWIPFSLAEFLIILIPVIVFALTCVIIKKYGETTAEILSALLCVFSILASIFSTFTLGFSSAYRGTTLDKKLGITAEEVSAQQLYDTALVLIDNLNETVDEVYYGADGYTATQRINSMRREFYEENKERINEQKRDAYAKRKERESSKAEETDV